MNVQHVVSMEEYTTWLATNLRVKI